jgi:hypothetical protein
MRKLKLEVDELEVQSFRTERDGQRERGTVRGRATFRQWSCDATCAETCGVPASCELLYNYCGTYPELGCPNSLWYCTDDDQVC